MVDLKQEKILAIVFIIVIIIVIVVTIIFLIRYSPVSDTSAAVTGCETVTPPSNLTALSSNTVNILVNYSAVTNASKYIIYLGTVPGFTKSNSFAQFSTAGTEYTITGQLLGRTYYVFVEAYNNCNNPSQPSSTVSVTVGYPSRFRITSQQQPSLSMSINANSEIILAPNCTGVGGDNKCVFTFDGSGFHNDTDTSNCLKSSPSDIQLQYQTCSVFQPAEIARQTWTYNSSNGSFCNDSTSDGILCAKIYGTAIPGQIVSRNVFDNTTGSKWNIIQV